MMTLREAHEVIEHKLFQLTFFAASKPWTTIASVIGFTAIMMGGFFSDNFVVESKMENLYVPLDSRAYESFQYISDKFGQDYNELVLIHATEFGDNVLTKEVFDSLWNLHDAIFNLKLDDKTYDDFCTMAGEQCFIISPLRFWDNRAEYNRTVFTDADVQEYVSAPSFADGSTVNRNFLFANHVTNGTEDTANFRVISAEGMQTYYPLNDFRISDIQAPEFEILWLEVCGVTGVPFAPVVHQLYEHIVVLPLASRTVDDELLRIIFIDMPLIFIEYVVMFLYTTACLSYGTNDEVRLFATSAGMWSVLFSTFAGYGFCAYIGVPFTSMTMVLPFILVGIGVDDMFIIIHTFRYVSTLKEYKDESIPYRIAIAVEKCGLSIVYTTATDVVAFALGSWSDIPSIQYFCTYAAFSVLADFAFQITFFIACFSIDEQRIVRNKELAKEEQEHVDLMQKDMQIVNTLKQGQPLMPSIHERSDLPPQPLSFTTPAVLVLTYLDKKSNHQNENNKKADDDDDEDVINECFHEMITLTYGDDIFQNYVSSGDFAYWFKTYIHGAVPIVKVKQLWYDSFIWLKKKQSGKDNVNENDIYKMNGMGRNGNNIRMNLEEFSMVVQQWKELRRISKDPSSTSSSSSSQKSSNRKRNVGGAADQGQNDDDDVNSMNIDTLKAHSNKKKNRKNKLENHNYDLEGTLVNNNPLSSSSSSSRAHNRFYSPDSDSQDDEEEEDDDDEDEGEDGEDGNNENITNGSKETDENQADIGSRTFTYVMHNYIKFVDTKLGKWVMLSFFALLTGFACYSSLQLEEKFDGAMVMPDVSYAADFFAAADKLNVFWDYEFPFHVVFRDIDVGDPQNQQNMIELMNDLQDKNRRIRGPPVFWLEDFLQWCEYESPCSNYLNEDGYFEGKNAGDKNHENGVNFRAMINSFLKSKAFAHYKADIILRDIEHYSSQDGEVLDDDANKPDGSVVNGSKLITVSRGGLNHQHIMTSGKKVDAMVSGYDTCKHSELGIDKAFTYSTIYIFVTQFQVIFGQTILNLILCLCAVGTVSLFTLESVRGVGILLLTISMMDFDLVGCIPIIGEHLNLITMICLIMAIGLMVDYLAHIMHYACIASPAPTSGPSAQVEAALSHIGPSVLLGASTTLIGVLPLGFASSYIFRIFFKMFIATILLALLHAFFFLPVMMIVFPVQIQASVHPTSEVFDSPEESAARAGASISLLSNIPSSSSSIRQDNRKSGFSLFRRSESKSQLPLMPPRSSPPPPRSLNSFEDVQHQQSSSRGTSSMEMKEFQDHDDEGSIGAETTESASSRRTLEDFF